MFWIYGANLQKKTHAEVWSHTLAWVLFCKLATYFQNSFSWHLCRADTDFCPESCGFEKNIFLISCSAAKALLPRTIELNIYTLYFLFSFFILFCSNSLSAFLFTCVLVTQSKILSQKSCLSLNTYIYLKLICRLEADSVLDLLQILPQI